MQKLLLLALLSAAAGVPRLALAQAAERLPLPPAGTDTLDEVVVIGQQRDYRSGIGCPGPGTTTYCPGNVTTRTDDLFYPRPPFNPC